MSCGVPQGSILGPLTFLLYMNDTARTVDCNLLLYADDSCVIFRDKSIKQIEIKLNRNFNTLCDWFLELNPFSLGVKIARNWIEIFPVDEKGDCQTK